MNTLAIDKLKGHFDDICDMLTEGDSYRKIAEHFDVSLGALHSFLRQDEHSARVSMILEQSAEGYTDKAEDALLTAKSDMVEIIRAKELAQLYKWKASKRNPKQYGDNRSIDIDVKVRKVLSPQQMAELREGLIRKITAPKPQFEDAEEITDTTTDPESKE